MEPTATEKTRAAKAMVRTTLAPRQLALWAVQAWFIADAAVYAAGWIYGQLSHDAFLSFAFSAKSLPLDRVSAIANVFAFTGQVLFVSLYTGVLLAAYCVRLGGDAAGWTMDILATLVGGMVGWSWWHERNPLLRALAVFTFAGLVMKWTPPVQRYLRKHAKLMLFPVFLLGATFNLWWWKEEWERFGRGRFIDPYYVAKPWAEFDSGDKLSAAFGLVVFVVAAFFWRRIKAALEQKPPGNPGEREAASS